MESSVLTESSRIFPFAFPSFGRVSSTLRYVDTKKASRDFNVEKWVPGAALAGANAKSKSQIFSYQGPH